MTRFLQADARSLPLADESVHMVVTSPPYWGLRDYGHAGQIGLEKTLAEYIAVMVGVFREVRRVLRADGTVWLNMGDGYSNDTKWGGTSGNKNYTSANGGYQGQRVRRGKDCDPKRGPAAPGQPMHPAPGPGFKPKDLLMQPHRLAIALQEDGWYVRSDIVWHKPNPMPESVTDRPTKSHEYLFLLAKGKRVARAVKFLNLKPEFVHFAKHLGAHNTYTGTSAMCVELATAIFNRAQSQHDFGLPPFYAQEWKHRAKCGDGFAGSDLPSVHPAAAHAARLLAGDSSTKDFLCEIHRLWSCLGNRHEFLIGNASPFSLPPHVTTDGDGSIAIHDAGQVRKVDFVHEQIVTTVTTTCKYYFDQEAVREAGRDWGTRTRINFRGGTTDPKLKQHGLKNDTNPSGRNLRTVWTMPTQACKEAHFATFPFALPEKCIKAGSSEKGVCPVCGGPWRRVVERVPMVIKRSERTHELGQTRSSGTMISPPSSKTTHWLPSCKCGADLKPIPATVLDIFGGAGTTALAAHALGRDCILIEAKREYIDIARKRLATWKKPKAKKPPKHANGHPLLFA